jgi:hypothetical protein
VGAGRALEVFVLEDGGAGPGRQLELGGVLEGVALAADGSLGVDEGGDGEGEGGEDCEAESKVRAHKLFFLF